MTQEEWNEANVWYLDLTPQLFIPYVVFKGSSPLWD